MRIGFNTESIILAVDRIRNYVYRE